MKPTPHDPDVLLCIIVFSPDSNCFVSCRQQVEIVKTASQEVMTKDNIPVNINAVIYFRVQEPKKAVLNVTNYMFAVSKYGQTSLRDIAGEVELDELLSEVDTLAPPSKNWLYHYIS